MIRDLMSGGTSVEDTLTLWASSLRDVKRRIAGPSRLAGGDPTHRRSGQMAARSRSRTQRVRAMSNACIREQSPLTLHGQSASFHASPNPANSGLRFPGPSLARALAGSSRSGRSCRSSDHETKNRSRCTACSADRSGKSRPTRQPAEPVRSPSASPRAARLASRRLKSRAAEIR
jgi:hypothetical protein